MGLCFSRPLNVRVQQRTRTSSLLMKEDINEVGPLNVIQVITDNAHNCKAARQLIEAQFPALFAWFTL